MGLWFAGAPGLPVSQRVSYMHFSCIMGWREAIGGNLKSQVSSTAVCPWCLSGGRRSCFTGVLNIDLNPKPPSGFLKRHFSENRTRWGEDKEQWTISIQAEDFVSPTGLFKVPLLLSAGLCCCWVENCKSTLLAKLHGVWSFHLPGFRRQVFKLLQHFSRLDHVLKSQRITDPGKRKWILSSLAYEVQIWSRWRQEGISGFSKTI